MKYLIILGDGMAGESLERLGDKTTLEWAKTPEMDRLAAKDRSGLHGTGRDGAGERHCQFVGSRV